ncbi:MAG: sensor histidine kinase [Lachnospiraceae bacterium]|nr:sensor histidine kinase [Lachnospiraceae bacterium]
MRTGDYIRDKMPAVIIGILSAGIAGLFFMSFRAPSEVCIVGAAVFLLYGAFIFLWDYARKKRFYDELSQNLEQLDKGYLVLEMLEKPDFLEGELLYQFLYEIDKSMAENVKLYEESSYAFKEYIEMWIHEVKIPIASLRLMTHNEETALPNKYVEQLRRLDNLVDKVLYYMRAEHAEKDYLIKETGLREIVKRAAIHNKDDLLEQDIDFLVEEVDYQITTDTKWLEFILNQLINNAMKYKRPQGKAMIRIWAGEERDKVFLHVRDNGIGIAQSDLPRIFEKSFTGENGRGTVKSTGMGLYIAKSLCDRLGHGISVCSRQGEYTEFVITIGKNRYYKDAAM